MNDFTNMERAEVLTAALPYIRKYTGQIVVVKYGGNAMINEQLKQQVMEDIVLLWLIGVKVVLVHGGGPEINDLMDRLGKKPAAACVSRIRKPWISFRWFLPAKSTKRWSTFWK